MNEQRCQNSRADWQIKANSAGGLKKRLSALDISVPPRSEGRKTEHCEWWSICRFLATYVENALLSYPLQLEKRERPDFLLRLPSGDVGIEVTEAIPQDMARADARREQFENNGEKLKLAPVARFRPGEKKSKVEIEQIARGQSSNADGLAGDEAEHDWADWMLSRHADKSKKKYPDFDSKWLLIYDNLQIPIVDVRIAARFVMQDLQRSQFDKVFIESGEQIWQFQDSAFTSHQIPRSWKSGETAL